jgi:hypothetical protein
MKKKAQIQFQHGRYYRVDGKFYIFVKFGKEFITQYPEDDRSILISSPNDEWSHTIRIQDAVIEEV